MTISRLRLRLIALAWIAVLTLIATGLGRPANDPGRAPGLDRKCIDAATHATVECLGGPVVQVTR